MEDDEFLNHNSSQDGEKEKRKKLRKYYEFSLIIFNIFFMLSGIILLVLGFYVWIYHRLYLELIPGVLSKYFYILFSTILLGILICFGTVFGVWIVGGKQKAVGFYLTYTLILLCVSMTEFLIGVISYDGGRQISSEFQYNLQDIFINKYNYSRLHTQIIDEIQRKFRCCGSRNFADWRQSEWYNNKSEWDDRLVPDSCCKTESPNCGVRDHPSNIAYTGCVHGLLKEITDCLGLIGALNLSLSILQLFGILYSILLFRHHLLDYPHTN